MTFLEEVTATAGQLVKDLESIVQKNPKAIPAYYSIPYDDEQDHSLYAIIGIENLLCSGPLLLTGGVVEEDGEELGMTAEALLSELKQCDPLRGIVLEIRGLQIKNILPIDNDGTMLQCGEEDKFIEIHYSEKDIRLVSWDQQVSDLNRWSQYPERKIVCRSRGGQGLYSLNDLSDDSEGYEEELRIEATFLRTDDSVVPEDALRVSSLLDLNPDNSRRGVYVEFEDGPEIWEECADSQYKAIKVEPGEHIFFEDHIGDEDVIAFRIGETVEIDYVLFKDLEDDREEEEEQNVWIVVETGSHSHYERDMGEFDQRGVIAFFDVYESEEAVREAAKHLYLDDKNEFEDDEDYSDWDDDSLSYSFKNDSAHGYYAYEVKRVKYHG